MSGFLSSSPISITKFQLAERCRWEIPFGRHNRNGKIAFPALNIGREFGLRAIAGASALFAFMKAPASPSLTWRA